jgi:hypothetical protein
MRKIFLSGIVALLIWSCSSEKKKDAGEIISDTPPIDTFDVTIPAGKSYQVFLEYYNKKENDMDSAWVELLIQDPNVGKNQLYKLLQDGKPVSTDVIKSEKENTVQFIITKWPFEKINSLTPGQEVDCDDLEASEVSTNGDTLKLDVLQYCYVADTSKVSDSTGTMAIAERLLQIKVVLQQQ